MGSIQSVPAELSTRLEAALRLGAEAAALAMRMRPPPGAAQASLKSRQDWLTEADGAVERFLSERLLAAFPDDGFQGEEDGATRTGRLRWVVDPIDGTSNFARGASRWCVSIGLMEGDAVRAGVLVAPALGETYAAVEGGGATLNGAPIHAAATDAIDRSIIEIGWSPRVDNADWQALSARVQGAGVMLRNGGSGAMGLAEVAAGRIDGYVERHINLWDCAAALAILAEAGARVSDFDRAGGPLLAASPGVFTALTTLAAGPDVSLAGQPPR
ncbi:MAG: inositol monophosphatase family protein [Janthinobacterium lividum]